MELLNRENFYGKFSKINEAYETAINSRSTYDIFYDANKKEYKIVTKFDTFYMQPNGDTFSPESANLNTYLKVQDNLIKNSNVYDPKRLNTILNQLGVYGLFSEEIKVGFFSNLKADLLEMGIEEPTTQEIVINYPNFNKWSNDAKVAFSKLAQEKVQYSIAKIDILSSWSTIKQN